VGVAMMPATIISVQPQPEPEQTITPPPETRQIPQRQGLVYGTVNIGPLCPVYPCNVNMARFYSKFKVALYTTGPNPVLVKQVRLNRKGEYELRVRPGTYVLNLNPNPYYQPCHNGPLERECEANGNVPREIVVKAGQASEQNIYIDTLIR
jgi:hypothetical protein